MVNINLIKILGLFFLGSSVESSHENSIYIYIYIYIWCIWSWMK